MGITKVFPSLRTIGLCLVSGLTGAVMEMHPAQAANIRGVDFLGESTFPTGYSFDGTEVGGLSGITYDSSKNVYYSISDDRSQVNPARFYTLSIDLSNNSLGAVNFTHVTTLLNKDGQPFAPLSLDTEGIAFTKSGDVFISSEGDANNLVNPFVNKFSLSGQQLQSLPVPGKFLPTSSKDSGIRNNLAFESLTVTPDQKHLFTATENALYQDGPAATTSTGSPSRILKYDATTGQPEQEFLYTTDPVAAESVPPEAFNTNGLVDLKAIDDNTFIGLERSFSTGVGNTIKLYEISLQGADDISSIDSLTAFGLDSIKAAKKTLLLDLGDLNIPLDNIEGLTFGPDLADGRRSLVVVSDNNFSPTQFTQVLAFGIRTEPVPEPSALSGLALLTLVGIGTKMRTSRLRVEKN